MDADFWTSRLAAAKRQFQHQHHLSDRLNMDDYEVEEEIRQDIPCPYCYEDFDIALLCNHLEDEHGTESKATRRRRLRRVALPTSQALSLLGRDLCEAHLQVLLGGSGYRSSSASTTTSAVTDPFLSSLVLNYSGSDQVDDFSKSLASASDDVPLAKNSLSPRPWKPSFDASLSGEERERRIRQATGKAGFMQDLLLCTLMGDQ
ncbi:DEHYDRATION-INDUCED 19-like protein [Drosera capensis]